MEVWQEACLNFKKEAVMIQKQLLKKGECSSKQRNKQSAKRTRCKNKLYMSLLEKKVIEMSRKLKEKDEKLSQLEIIPEVNSPPRPRQEKYQISEELTRAVSPFIFENLFKILRNPYCGMNSGYNSSQVPFSLFDIKSNFPNEILFSYPFKIAP